MGTVVEVFPKSDRAADLRILYLGREVCSPGHRWVGRRHHALLHIVESGRGRVGGGVQSAAVGPGGVFLFHPHEDITYEADRSDPWTYLWVGLGGRRLVPLLDQGGFRAGHPVIRPAGDPQAGGQLAALLDDLKTGAGAPGVELSRQARLLDLLAGLAVTDRPRDPAPVPYIPEILEFLETAYSRPLTTATIAAFAGLERTYCCRLFARTVGRPLMDYLTELRLEKALELLRTTELSVRAIGESVGYSDPSVFAKVFRRRKGRTPNQARSLG